MTPARTAPYQPLVVAATLVLTVAGLYWARAIFIPLALSILLSFILTPAVKALQNRGLKRVGAVILVSLVTFSIVVGLLAALTWQLHDLASDIVANKENIVKKVREAGEGSGVIGELFRLAEDVQADLRRGKGAVKPDPDTAVPVKVEAEKTSSLAFVSFVADTVYNHIGAIGLVIALTVSMLITREDLRNRLIGLIGHGHVTSTTRAFDEATSRIGRYLLLQMLLNAAYGIAFGMGLYLIGVPYALLWAFFAAVLRFIPYIGTWLGALPPLIVTLAIGTWLEVGLAATFVFLLGIATNNIVEPLLVSRSTEVSPFALVAAAAFWTWLWGPIGLILATPMTVCLSVLGRYVPGLQFLDTLLGSHSALQPELAFYQRLLARDLGEAEDLLERFRAEHSPEQLADEVVIPALVRLRADQEREELTQEDVDFIVRALRDLLNEPFVFAEEDKEPSDERPAVSVVGCPAHDEREELALGMLFGLVGERVEGNVLSSKLTAAEIVERVAETEPALVCVVSLAPRGRAQARYLCKRLRGRDPKLTIVAGCLGGDEPNGADLASAGASKVEGSLADMVRQVKPLLALDQPATPR
ncbi:MAG: AI-2E family transporter [Gemmataceae bacterium]|nr:AI-2E family transporter [Gemmataceae bacterium]MCI0740803.1 AI-2E family transporter [Gemmataceae bacterium]